MKQGILQRKKSFLLASPACSFCSLLPFAQLPPACAVPFYNLIFPGMPAYPWWQVPSGAAFLYFSVLLTCIFKCFLFPLSISSSPSTSPNTHNFVELTFYPNLFFPVQNFTHAFSSKHLVLPNWVSIFFGRKCQMYRSCSVFY